MYKFHLFGDSMNNNEYDFKTIEKKWQSIWEKDKYGIAEDFSKKEKYYHLIEFPYPSGSGLHVGHCMMNTAADAICRMQRMKGKNVMLPIGWDAFGLPTENYAIKTGVLPQVATENNVAIFKRQIKSLGYAFDWSREINTTDPAYYHWTQWIFLQFYKHAMIDGKLVEVADDDRETPRLAFQSEMPINWCPSCKIGLANEEVIGGKCERCGSDTERRNQKQWMLRITAYADRLIKDLDTVDYLEKIKTQQVNWIGRSEGSNIRFKIKDLRLKMNNKQVEVFTTRADTLFGCAYVVLAPENSLVAELKECITNYDEVLRYVSEAAGKSDLERTEIQKEKTGVELKGVKAINPINSKEVSVWVADYVLASYGTGAVMAVPSHDDRDFEFAKKYNIEIIDVVMPKVVDKHDPPVEGIEIVRRNAVHAIVVDPETNKVLTLKWKKFPWIGFVVCGVEEGESLIEAASREIIEESGYKNFKYIRSLGGPVESHFYAAHKGHNRVATFTAHVFELVNHEQDVLDKAESDQHEVTWMTWDEIYKSGLTAPAEQPIWEDRFHNPEHAFTDYGVLYNSDEFDGLESREAATKITEKLKKLNLGDFTVNYKLRDWVFSRQHYWGEPIPIIHCDKCGLLPLNEDDLPLELPKVEKYQPTDNGESPLAAITNWVNVKCPKCGGEAKRETDTMPNWAGSSWYFLAYTLSKKLKAVPTSRQVKSKNGNIFKDGKNELDYWMPVNFYDGGMEHTTLHLLYSRFWHKFLYDLHEVEDAEPYAKRGAHGMILGPDGQKMSKSKGNVINPDDIAKELGADTLRAYIMFIGPYDQESAWNTSGVQGVHRFLKRVWNNVDKITSADDDKELLIKLNQTIQGVEEDYDHFRLNTVISKLMEFNNTLEKVGHISRESFEKYLILLHTAAPHIASELWQICGNTEHIFQRDWVTVDKQYLLADEITVVFQVNGKVRDKMNVSTNILDSDLKQKALSSEKVIEHISGKEIVKVIVIPGKLVSIVTA